MRRSSRPSANNPAVALTIDTEVHPPKILLVRGRAELDFVDGIPDEYPQATSTYEMTPRATGRLGGGSAFALPRRRGPDRRAPSWAKLIDCETTLPSAVEELVLQQEQRQHG